jgi:hypothetical protein
MGKMQEAFRFLKSGRNWQTVKDEWFIEGSIRATEVTYGQNGWHPHYHEISLANVSQLSRILKGDLTYYAATLENQLRPLWQAALERFGLTADLTIGLTVRGSNRDVSGYVAKWGILPVDASEDTVTHEITSSHTKIARRGSFGVVDILFAAGEGDTQAKALFVEYAQATKGRSRLQWSKGLKERLGIDDIRDEIASEGITTESDILLATIPQNEWSFLARTGHLGQLMTYANEGNIEKMNWLLTELRGKMPKVERFDFSGF